MARKQNGTARKRRGRGEGSISQRKDGSWEARISVGYEGTGKRRRKSVYGKTKSEVQKKLRELQNAADDGVLLLNSDRTRLSDYLAWWLEKVVLPNPRRNTYASYEGVVRNHINVHLGGTALASLTSTHIRSMLDAMTRAGTSARMRQLAYAVLHRALGRPIEKGKVRRDLWEGVERPRVPKKTMQFYSAAEVVRFLEAARGNRLEALFVLAVSTGLRQGELFGLQWPDIDLDKGLIFVQRQLEEVQGHLAMSEPKSEAGRRLVALPPFAVEALRRHREKMQAEDWLDHTVFCDTRGGWLRKSNFMRQVFKPLLKRADLREVRFHDLRHSHASALLAAGIHPKVVQERLGHSQIQLTLDTYSHTVPSLQQEAASRMEDLFGNKKKPGDNRQPPSEEVSED